MGRGRSLVPLKVRFEVRASDLSVRVLRDREVVDVLISFRLGA